MFKFKLSITALYLGLILIPSLGSSQNESYSVNSQLIQNLLLDERDFHTFDENQARLGQLLFYDPILSGNRNISCGTCHHHNLNSSDGLSLGLGQGGAGIGMERKAQAKGTTIRRRMPRNSPALFNLGAKEIRLLFHDGRVSLDDYFDRGFNTPAEEFLPEGLNSLLAAQALFPLVGGVEMAGNLADNEVATAFEQRIDYGWPVIIDRIRNVPEYEEFFVSAFNDVDSFQDVSIVHVANAIGAFVGSEWQSFDSPFDDFIAGNEMALSDEAKKGMGIFFGKGNCSSCHSGKLFTDQNFHALAIPPFGPGRTRPFDLIARDVGRMGETDLLQDAYRFRTPSLRNVALSAPYGHNGAFRDLKGIIKHHLNPLESLENWSQETPILPDLNGAQDVDFIVWEDRFEIERLKRNIDILPVQLADQEITYLVAFLESLTGKKSVSGRLGRPDNVPSGLTID